jgi:hypothetical protein
MTIHFEPSTLAVCLREETILSLLNLRQAEGETLESVISRLAELAPHQPTYERGLETKEPVVRRACPENHGLKYKYRLAFLGEELGANTLSELFGALVDSLALVAAEATEKLASMKSRKRAFISRDRGSIHPGRPDLKTLKTATGWWISANIGRVDLSRALDAVCEASGLEVGKDIRFLI